MENRWLRITKGTVAVFSRPDGSVVMLKWRCRLSEVRISPAVIMMPLLAACGSGDLTLNEADPDIVAQKPTWEQVYPIFQRQCIPCHAGTDEDPDDDSDDEREIRISGDLSAARLLDMTASSSDPGLESCLSIINNLDDIITTIFIDNNMPPGAWPRLTSKEKLTINRWIDQGAEGACE